MTKTHHDVSQKQNQTRNSRGTVLLCGGKKYHKCNRNIMERALEVQKEVCLCYFEDTKAFDKVRHDEIITQHS